MKVYFNLFNHRKILWRETRLTEAWKRRATDRE